MLQERTQRGRPAHAENAPKYREGLPRGSKNGAADWTGLLAQFSVCEVEDPHKDTTELGREFGLGLGLGREKERGFPAVGWRPHEI